MSGYTPYRPAALTWLGVILLGVGFLGLFLLPEKPAATPVNARPLSSTEQGPVQAREAFNHKTQMDQNLHNTPLESAQCRVLTVYDGDTMACDINRNGRIERPEEEIRLLGIDTPEMHYSKKNRSYRSAKKEDEPFAAQASAYLKKTMLGKTAYLSFDQERYDRYGRTLAYVSLKKAGQADICEAQLAQGFAKTLFIPPNFYFKNRFKTMADHAQEKQLGIWK